MRRSSSASSPARSNATRSKRPNSRPARSTPRRRYRKLRGARLRTSRAPRGTRSPPAQARPHRVGRLAGRDHDLARTMPHGKCLYCPGGPDSEFSSSQSYTGEEPAAARASRTITTLRAGDAPTRATARNRPPVDKVELILMGGTMTARSHDYQEWFVKRTRGDERFRRREATGASGGVSFAQDPDEYEWRYVEDVIAETRRTTSATSGRRSRRNPTGAIPSRSTGCSKQAGPRSKWESRPPTSG